MAEDPRFRAPYLFEMMSPVNPNGAVNEQNASASDPRLSKARINKTARRGLHFHLNYF